VSRLLLCGDILEIEGFAGAKRFIAFSSPFSAELIYAGFATMEVAKWTFKKN
jgi:hypothetical protein